MKQYDIVIIGGGIAGMTAGIYVRRAGRSVIVLDEKTYGGQIIQTMEIANWPGDPGVSGADLSKKIYHQMNNLGVDFEYAEVLVVEDTGMNNPKERFLVKTDDGDYSCGAIIIATGTVPRELPPERVKEAAGRPISYCATCDGAFYKDKPVIVIGRGKTAESEIKYLKNIASKVYSVYREDPFPEDAAAIFVAIGREPNTEIFEGFVKIDENGYIVAGEDCKTSRDGVFVAGDVRTKQVRQLVTAAGDGAVAAKMAVEFLG